jgi:hypothetical protein
VLGLWKLFLRLIGRFLQQLYWHLFPCCGTGPSPYGSVWKSETEAQQQTKNQQSTTNAKLLDTGAIWRKEVELVGFKCGEPVVHGVSEQDLNLLEVLAAFQPGLFRNNKSTITYCVFPARLHG